MFPRHVEAFRRSPDGHENLFRDSTRHVVYRSDIIHQVTIVTTGIKENIVRQAFQLYLQEYLIQSFFFQNKEIFVQLYELDELDRITHA